MAVKIMKPQTKFIVDCNNYMNQCMQKIAAKSKKTIYIICYYSFTTVLKNICSRES